MTSKVEMGLMAGGIFPAANVSKGGQNPQDAFQGIMFHMTAAGQSASNAQDYQPKETAAVKQTAAVKETAGQSGETAENAVSNRKPADTVNGAAAGGRPTEAEKAAAGEAEEEILAQTAEALGITVDELEEILAQMGLTAWDLLEPENVSALVVQVMGDGDMLSLVTDEKLSQTVLDLNVSIKEIGAELAGSLGIEESDIKTALDGMLEKLQNVEESEAPVQKTEAAVPVQTVSGAPAAEEPDGYADAKDGGEAQDTVIQSPAETAGQDGSPSPETQAGQKGFDRSRMEDASDRRQPVRENPFGALEQAVADRPAIQEAALEAARELMGSSPAEIINQINAYIRQNAATRVTEWQMQLNPEHLGTVGLNVTAKEGAVTAQFTTQNEAVKAVMEAQAMVLKENLEQQGIKVEAVEVTVASHEFEENLQQGDDSDRQAEEERENLRKATRKIDLGEFASPEEGQELDEAEQVTVEMMRADGNRMDYKV